MNARLLLCFCLLFLLAACQGASTRQGARGFSAESARNLVVESARPMATGATRKLALVIGNDDYPEAPLRNPLNDARDMAAMLARLGFEVIHEDNRNKQQMEELVRRFGDRLRPGMVGMFYFAGHGIQLKDHNYLIPVQSGIQREDEVPYHAFDVGQLLSKMESAGNNSNLVFLDACRDNPFARGFRSATFTGGFSFGDAPSGTLIAYAAKSGMKSKDGDRQNGLYTEALLKRMATPGLKITDLLIEVRNEVKRATNGSQIPWEEVGLESNFCFAGCGSQPPSPAPAPEAPPAPRPVSPDAAEQEYWDNVKASADLADYQAYLDQYPRGRHAALARNAIQRLRPKVAQVEVPPVKPTSIRLPTPPVAPSAVPVNPTPRSDLAIGDTYQGGIIFYLDDSGQHGLIAAPKDQVGGNQWCNGYNSVYITTGATGTAVGAGEANTAKIIAAQGTGDYAASLTANLVLNGHRDWFLPSRDELDLMYRNIGPAAPEPLRNIGGFGPGIYWSSSEYVTSIAWTQNFVNGDQTNEYAVNSLGVRPVRAF